MTEQLELKTIPLPEEIAENLSDCPDAIKTALCQEYSPDYTSSLFIDPELNNSQKYRTQTGWTIYHFCDRETEVDPTTHKEIIVSEDLYMMIEHQPENNTVYSITIKKEDNNYEIRTLKKLIYDPRERRMISHTIDQFLVNIPEDLIKQLSAQTPNEQQP